jgi:hypothetical protein
MLDRKYACEVLGLPEDATRQQIEDRFFVLVKKYKGLDPDEQPSANEPPFAKINEAYRFLIGYKPLRPVKFRELNWREKWRHLREHYTAEIVTGLVAVLVVLAMVAGVAEFFSALRASGFNPGDPASPGVTAEVPDPADGR